MTDSATSADAPPPLPGQGSPTVTTPLRTQPDQSRAAGFAPIRGVTVGTVNADPVSGQDHTLVQRTIGGQAISGALFIAALIPPVIVCLLFSVQHRTAFIPYSPIWAWGSLVVALVLAAQAALAGERRGGVSGVLSLSIIFLLLIAPAAVLVYLGHTSHAPNLRLAIAQMILYAVATIALLVGSLSFMAVE